MAKTDLKTFSIETYDIELDYNRQIAPIQKKIDRLDNNHETKSLKAHKDFLTKEKQSKKKIQDLESKLDDRFVRIEKAVENKLIKTSKKEASIKKQFSQYKEAQNEALKQETSVIEQRTLELKDQEQEDLNVVKDKYKKNVESYVEKLDTYNSNFENNKVIFSEQYAKYSKILQEQLELIKEIKDNHEQKTKELLDTFIAKKDDENNVSNITFIESEKELSNYVLNIRKESNSKAQVDRQYVASLKKDLENKYKEMIEQAKNKLRAIEINHEKHIKRINKDLEINLGKIDKELESLEPKTPKRVKKDLLKRKELFEQRATTTLSFEELLQIEKQAILNNEIAFLQETYNAELINFDKLYVFLLNDHEQLKEAGEFFKSLNIELLEELSNSEIKNNDYLVSHERLTTEFINGYITEFNNIKKRLIDSNMAQIDQLTTINSELDDINKFLDTVEPLKEIELNHLRESIESNEIEERYNIKYAKQDHEAKLLKNNNIREISLEELNMKNSLKDNDMQITEIKAKETLDKASEQAKLKYQKAEEVKKLRLNSSKLERNILKSSYETQLQKYELFKDLAVLEVRKQNAIISKSIDKEIDNIEIEANYKSEVVTKSNEEEILKLQEQITKIESERDSFASSVMLLIDKEEKVTDDLVAKINDLADGKLVLIDEALERECKEPLLNIARSEVIIKERINKFDNIHDNFDSYNKELLEQVNSTTLTPEQRKTQFVKNKIVIEKTKTYIDTLYSYVVDALNYMQEVSEKRQLTLISTTTDESKIKKLKKQITKEQQECKRQIQSVTQSKKEQIGRVTTLLKNKVQSLQKLKGLEEEGLIEQVTTILTNNLEQLSKLNKTLVKECKDIYLPLTKQDQQIVDHANKNAVKAKENIERERELEIAPINQKYGDFIKDKELEKERVVNGYNAQIQKLQDNIDSLNESSKQKVQEVNEQQYKEIEQRKNRLNEIKNAEERIIAERIEAIKQQRTALEQDYHNTLLKLEEKDLEAEKIYEYEERIYKIALETAESRFNETVSKASKRADLNKDDSLQAIQTVKDVAERNIERINKELLDLTSQFEKNIFTVRPRFEESIGDAQRAIDEKATLQLARREELLEQNALRTSSIQEGLEHSFKEAYDNLERNLNTYIEKYQLVENDYKETLQHTNKVIEDGHVKFTTALYELGKSKIDKIRVRMRELNDKLS